MSKSGGEPELIVLKIATMQGLNDSKNGENLDIYVESVLQRYHNMPVQLLCFIVVLGTTPRAS